MAKLSDAEVKEDMEALNGWSREGNYLTKEFKFKQFMSGIRFVEKVAKIAEKQEHHPDIHVIWTTVTLKITTHDEGGLTKWDMKLAKEIDKRLGSKRNGSGRKKSD